MRLLRNFWFRLFISFIGGNIILEIIRMSSKDPNGNMNIGFIFLFALLLYVLLTFIVKKTKKPDL